MVMGLQRLPLDTAEQHPTGMSLQGTVNLPPFAIRSHNFQFVMEP
jgi:hypothetical protein